MGFFDATAALRLKQARVLATPLIHFDFLTTPGRYHTGFGSFTSGGFTWTGLADLATISGLESAIGGIDAETTFTLSGLKASHIAAALDQSTEAVNRPVTVVLQFFDDALQVLGTPYAIYAGTMDTVSIEAPDATTRMVSVTAHSLFVRRAASPWAWLTDRDQNRLHLGDRALEQVPTMASKNPKWPKFEDI